MRGKWKPPPGVALHVVFVSILSWKRPDSSHFAPRYRPPLSYLHGCSGKTRPTCWRFQRTTGSGAEDRRQRKMHAISTSMIKGALITDLRSELANASRSRCYQPSFPCYRCEVSLFWNGATNGCEVSKHEHFKRKMPVQRCASRLCIRVNLHISGNIRWRPVRHRLRYAPFSLRLPVLRAGFAPSL